MARPHLTRIGWTFRRAMAAWRLIVRRGLSRRLRYLARYLSRFTQPRAQPPVFVPVGSTGTVEATVVPIGEPAHRDLPDHADAIILAARQALLDATALAPLEDVVLRGASVEAVVTNGAGERYVVTARSARRDPLRRSPPTSSG